MMLTRCSRLRLYQLESNEDQQAEMQRFQKYSPEAICKQFAEQVPHGFHKRLVIVGDANVTMDYTKVGKKEGKKKATIERAHTRIARFFSLSLSLLGCAARRYKRCCGPLQKGSPLE